MRGLFGGGREPGLGRKPGAPGRTAPETTGTGGMEKKPYTVWNLISIASRRFYDDLGSTLLANGYWALLVGGVWLLPSLLIGKIPLPDTALAAMVAVLGVLVIGPATAGLYGYVVDILLWKDPPASDVFRGFVRHLLPAIGLTLILLGFAAFFWAGALICMVKITPDHPRLGFFLFTVQLWGMLFLGLMHLYPFAFLVRQGTGPWTAFKRGAIVALSRPVCSLVALLLALLLAGVSVLFRGLPLLFAVPAMLAFVGSTGVLCMLEEYEE